MASKSGTQALNKTKAKPRLVTVISGASTGIGALIAARFAQAGFDLVLVARSADKLESLAQELMAKHGVQVFFLPLDLAKENAPQLLAAWLKQHDLQVETLVNNAGILEQGGFTAIAPERHQAIIQLNISSLTAMLSEFLPAMLQRGHGRILNVASIAAFQPVVSLASYAASKAYVLSLSEALAEECKGTGVTVTALCPGITATNMVAQASAKNASLNQIPEFMVGDPAFVAEQAFQACMAGEAIRVPGVINLASTVLARAAPKWLVRRLAGALGRTAM